MCVCLPLQLLFIITVSSTLSQGLSQERYECIHDKIAEKNPYIVNLAEINQDFQSKRQTTTDFSSIRIHTMPTNINAAAESHVYGANSTLSRAVEIFESILMVHPVEGNFVVPPECDEYSSGPNEGKCDAPLPDDNSYGCGEFGVIPNEYIGRREVCPTYSGPCYLDGPNGTGIPHTDYLLFVSAASTFSCSGGTLAYASSCMLDMSDNYRPVAGYINICPSSLDLFSQDIILGIVVHEIIHALGFSRFLYGRYVDDNGNSYDATMSVMGPYGMTNLFTGPKTVELARSYYSCESIEGVSLENEGGGGTASSHWEKRTLHHELMNGYVSSDYLVLSEFTAALFEDTGWYRTNYSALSALDQHTLEWGKGLGCSFLTERCINQTVYPYLCDTNDDPTICTFDHLSKGRCSSDWNGFDGCAVAVATDSDDYCRSEAAIAIYDEIESYTSNSICVDGIRSVTYDCGIYITQPAPVLQLCVSQETYSVNNTFSYAIQAQSAQYSCSDGHAVVANSDWILLCPPTEEVVSQSSLIINDDLPSTLARIVADDLSELGSIVFLIDQDILAFGGLEFGNNIVETFNVNLLDVDATTICLFGCLNCIPVLAEGNATVSLEADALYAINNNGTLVASTMLTDVRTQSTDYSLVLMFNPQARYSFVYYAISVDFVGDYLRSLHSNDYSTFSIIALARNTEVRISPSKTVTVNGTNIAYGEEYVWQLDEGQSLLIQSSEDLTGSRVTSNKATSFYSGHMCAQDSSTNCSILVEQIPPYNSWGNRFFLHTNASGIVGTMFKILASDAGANVSVNCTSDGYDFENRNFYLGFRQTISLSFSHSYCAVHSVGSILIVQFQDSHQQNSMDTYMTIVPAVNQFRNVYVFNTYNNSIASLIVNKMDPSGTPILLNNVPLSDMIWERVTLDEMTYFYGTIALPLERNKLNFLGRAIEFGVIIYGFNGIDSYAFAAGLELDLATDLPTQVPSPVQEASLTVVEDVINVTWAPPAVANGVIYQYIVQQFTLNDVFYHHISSDEYSVLLPFFNTTRIFVTAVNLYGHSSQEFVEPSIDICFPSPCFNGGTCVVLSINNLTSFQCQCNFSYVGEFCQTRQVLYPFGLSQNDFRLASFSESSSQIFLSRPFYLYNNFFQIAYINENGFISLGSRFISRTPVPFSASFFWRIIAPYWADVDLGGAGQVYYRQTTDANLMLRATFELQSAFPSFQNQTITNLLIVTWDSVRYFSRGTDKSNTFQCILSFTDKASYVTFIYTDIQWTTGDASGGTNGLGGTEALAGINAGDGINFITIPGSLTPDIINITSTSNVGIPGVWMFEAGEVFYSANIVADPPGYPTDDNNVFEYFTETNLVLTCSISPTPPSNSEYSWSCSTGCFADMQMEQTISVTISNETDGGIIHCSVVVDGVQYSSEVFEVQVIDEEICQIRNITCVTEFYSFGLSENDAVLRRLDDTTSPSITLSEIFYFYGQAITTVYVGDNGIIGLNNRYNHYEPRSLPLNQIQFVTPFWADVDLTGTGQVYYRQTNDSTLLARASNEIKMAFPMSQNVNITNLLIVTWDSVGYYSANTDKTNTFQCILATSAIDSFVIFLYADQRIQWTTGDASGGNNGLGGTEALAGINAGDGINSITIPGSLTPSILNIAQTSNVDISGVWMFSVGQVTFDVTIITLPAAIGSNYTNAYFTGTDLTLTCMVTPTPPFDSEFYWNCSSGCFADMEMEQIIQVTDLEETDSGVLSCSVLINGIQYVSESVELVIVEAPNVRILADPIGIPLSGPGSTETFVYFNGTDLSLSCLVTPIPSFDIEFTWSCIFGCFADRVMTQNISVMNLNETDDGILRCRVNVIGVDFFSESFELRVVAMVTYNVAIITIPPVDAIPGSNNTFAYFNGINLTLICSVTPSPPFFDSQYNWNCSTGCFADMDMQPFIEVADLDEIDSGVLSCSVSVYGEEYISEVIEIEVVKAPNVSILVGPLSEPVPGSTNIYRYDAGTNIRLSCSVIPTPSSDVEFSWSCSTGCFADMAATQNISVMSLDAIDSGIINCLANINGMVLSSEPIELQVITIVFYTVDIVTNPPGYPTDENNTFQFFTETDLILTCFVSPTPPSNSEYNWSCSTGCFADMQMEQTISVTISNETDGGILHCSVVVDGVQYFSELFILQVIGDEFCQSQNILCVSEFYPFGPSESDDALLTNFVDTRSPLITLSQNFYFYDQVVTSVYVGDNGIISLTTPYNDWVPRSLPLNNIQFITPFWADVDLTGTGQVYYRQTNNSALLNRANYEIQAAFPLSQNVNITNLLIVTWDSVGYFSARTDKTNTFQCILATSAAESFVIFLYPALRIQWTTGDASGGTNGLGGTEALAGINAGDGINSITIPGSLTPSILNIAQTSNVDTSGVWIFRVGQVSYNVSIVGNPLGNPVAGASNVFEYLVGTELNLTCSVIPAAPEGSEFSWSCSTGCFADMEMEQTININELQVVDSGVINCSVIIDEVEYFSEPFELQVTDMVTYNVTINTFPVANGSNNTFEYFTGTNLTLTCVVTPTPPLDSEFYWNCSTGCFADMEMEQIIQVTDLEETDSGVLSCNVFINGTQYVSESVELVIVEVTDPDPCQAENGVCTTNPKLYPFGSSQNDTVLPPGIDADSPQITFSEDFIFYNQTILIAHVGDNGIISFTNLYNGYNPVSLPLTQHRFVAPYWSDVDTRGTGEVFYRQTDDPVLLTRVANELQAASLSQDVIITNLFIATWNAVGYYNLKTDKTNTYQCILASSESASFVIFVYTDIQWTTGDGSAGFNGLGGNEAVAGINAGDGINSITIPGSQTPDIINITDTSNVGIPGVWMFAFAEDLVVCFNESQLNVTEDQGLAIIELILTAPSSLNITFTIIATNGTAVGGVDYDPGPYRVTIPAGQTRSSFSVQIYDDNIYETNETFTLSIDTSTLPGTVEVGPDCMLQTTILDDDGIVVNFEQITYNVDEDNGPLQVALVLSNPSSSNVTIEVLNTDESARENVDYNSGPYIVTFPPRVIRYQFDVSIFDDNVLENNENFRLNINGSSLISGITVGSLHQASIYIVDEDSVTVGFTQQRYNGTEDAGIVQVAVELIGGTVSVPVNITITPSEQSPPSAQGNVDFSTAVLTITISSGATMNTTNIVILPDTIVESDEMFDLSMIVPPLFNGRLSAGNQVNAVGVIIDQTSCVVDEDCTSEFGDFCKIECPANSYPTHTTLLQEPISFNGTTFAVVSANRQPDFSGQITFFAKFSQIKGSRGFLLFYGTDSTSVNFAVEIDSSSNEDVTLLIIYSYSNGMYTVSPLSLNRRIDDGIYYCLTIIFDIPVMIYLNGDLIPGTLLTLRNIDFTFRLTESNPASLLVGGVPPNIGYFQGEIVQIVIFNGFLDVNSLDYDETIFEYSNIMNAVCSLLDRNYMRYGRCQRYLKRGEACPPPTMQSSELCISDLDRCDPSLRCFPDILGRHTCQYVPPICTNDADCLDESYFCGEEQPAYTSVGYLEPNRDIISGDKTTYISTPINFEGLMVMKRPGTDHPNLDSDLTIFTILQQDLQNNGYVITKGADRVNRDWALYLQSPQNQVILSYRTYRKTSIITFNNLEFGDGKEHTIAAVISGIKSVADNKISRALLYIDGILVGVQEQIEQPKFQPGLNFLYIGGTPEALESARDRFSGTITYLAVYNTALSYGEIAQLSTNVKSNFLLERYCKEYVQPNGYCYIGDVGEYRCMPPARCVPVVKNNLIVTTPLVSSGQIISQNFHLTAELPRSGSRFDVRSIIGRCINPCSCANNELSNKVCGADGRTYDSECDATCAGVNVVDPAGPCTFSYAELYRRMQES